jgi:hypothetical protein
MQITSVAQDSPLKYQHKWKLCNEERAIAALKKFGGLKLRIRFDMWEEWGESGKGRWKLIKGSTVSFRKIPTIGLLWKIVNGLTNKAVEIVRGPNAGI